jgi:hypothetical protein
LEALQDGGGDFHALARHAAAAYLNATDADVDYSISKNDVVVGVTMLSKLVTPHSKTNWKKQMIICRGHVFY